MSLSSKIVLVSVSLVLSGYFITPSKSHTMGLGACPKVQPMKDFNMEKLLGEWFVIQKFATTSTCMRYNFTIGPDKVMRLVQTKQHFVLDKMGVDHIYSYAGVLSVPDLSLPSKMRVKFPLNIAGEADFMIYDTDYDNYAGVFTCQKILFGHTRSASILSRKSTLHPETIKKLRKTLSEQDIDVEDFSVVSQSKCITKDESNLSFKIDDRTFGTQKWTKSVKEIGKVAGTGISAANTLMESKTVKDGNAVISEIE